MSSSNVTNMTDPSRGYQQLLEEMKKLQLGFVGDRLPPADQVASSSYNQETGECSVAYKGGIRAGVSRDGTLMPGAEVDIQKEVKFKVEHDQKAVAIEGFAAGILGNTFSGRVEGVSAQENGDITVRASTNVLFARVSITQTFHPEKPKSLFGWQFDPKGIKPEYSKAPEPHDGSSAPDEAAGSSSKGWWGSWG